MPLSVCGAVGVQMNRHAAPDSRLQRSACESPLVLGGRGFAASVGTAHRRAGAQPGGVVSDGNRAPHSGLCLPADSLLCRTGVNQFLLPPAPALRLSSANWKSPGVLFQAQKKVRGRRPNGGNDPPQSPLSGARLGGAPAAVISWPCPPHLLERPFISAFPWQGGRVSNAVDGRAAHCPVSLQPSL